MKQTAVATKRLRVCLVTIGFITHSVQLAVSLIMSPVGQKWEICAFSTRH